MTTGGFSPKRLTRVRDVLSRYVDAGYAPGAVAVVARRGEVHIEAAGNLAFAGEGANTPMAADTIWRAGSMSKPLAAACAMTLVEDGTLRLDDPVDEFLPELADMTVLADPNGPLDNTVPARRPITLRDLLTFTFGTGILGAGGTRHGARVLSRPSVTLMTTDHLTPAQKAVSGFGPGYFDDFGWGLGMSVRTRRAHSGPLLTSYPPLASAGSYGWPGYYGTGWCNDPAEDMTTIFAIQRAPGPPGLPFLIDFWTAAYTAIDD